MPRKRANWIASNPVADQGSDCLRLFRADFAHTQILTDGLRKNRCPAVNCSLCRCSLHLLFPLDSRSQSLDRFIDILATTKPYSVLDAQRRRAQVFLSPHSSLLSPPLLGGRAYRPPLCGGSAPATPPLLQPRVVVSVWAIRNCRPVSARFPRQLAVSENVPARARQAKPLPYMPNVHRYDHREPPTDMLAVHSPQTDRKQYTHRTWLSSYPYYIYGNDVNPVMG